MADNELVDAPIHAGGDIVAADDIGGIKHPRFKVEFGDHGVATDVSASNPLPTTMASQPLPAGAATEASLATLVTRNPVTSFGAPLVAALDVITTQHFTYGVQPHSTKTIMSTGSTIVGTGDAGNGSDLAISVNTTVNAFAIARSFRAVHYRPGIGQFAQFSAAFNAGVASSQQFAGLWSPSSGYFIGYSGATWGCFARTGGSPNIRTLTVTTAATSANNATVTIDGTAVVIALTNQTGNPSNTAWEISQADFSLAGQSGTWGWDAYALGAVVYFVARRARVVSGAFTFAAGSSGSAATFANIRSGAAEVDDFGSPGTPGNFTFLDALDGTGPSGLNLNKQNGIIYSISAGHLGHRGARFYVMNPITGSLVLFADYRYMGTQVASALTNPTMYMAWGVVSGGSTTAMTLTAGSGLGALESQRSPDEGEPWSVSSAKTATSATAVHYLSVRNGPIAGFSGQKVRASRIDLRIDALEITASSAAATTSISVSVLRNPTQTSLANYAMVDATRLALWAWVDTTTTTVTTTAGQSLESPQVNTEGSTYLVPLNLTIEPGGVVAVVVTASAGSVVVGVTMRGREIQ